MKFTKKILIVFILLVLQIGTGISLMIKWFEVSNYKFSMAIFSTLIYLILTALLIKKHSHFLFEKKKSL